MHSWRCRLCRLLLLLLATLRWHPLLEFRTRIASSCRRDPRLFGVFVELTELVGVLGGYFCATTSLLHYYCSLYLPK